MQLARFLDRGTTGLAGDRNELFRGEFFAFHWKMMQELAAEGCSILLIFNGLAISPSLQLCSIFFAKSGQN